MPSTTTSCSSTTSLSPDLLSVHKIAEQWCQHDPNPTTVEYVRSLLLLNSHHQDPNKDSSEELRRLFPTQANRRITFGTSGLRGRFQPGPLGMNELVVLQTAQGLARYIEQQQQEDVDNVDLRVVIGYDHRAVMTPFQLSSEQFALLSALVFIEAGWKRENVIVLHGFLPTPLVPFACQQLNAPLGIMITASHNPPQDAGYKIYYRACQILSPRDVDIQHCIEQNLLPWTNYQALLQEQQRFNGSDDDSHGCFGWSNPELTNQIVDSYFDALLKSGLYTSQYPKYLQRIASRVDDVSQLHPSPQNPPLPLIVYTAMHGVGLALARRVFETFQLPPFYSVPQQEKPDPSFPTVPFPNPEERHALDLAKEYGLQLLLEQQQQEEVGSDNHCNVRNVVVLANDPDADRLAVAEYNALDQTWNTLTGDQIGILLGHWLWTQMGVNSDKPVAMCQSMVSSRMLAEIGRVEGFHVEETMTGFKWIGTRAKQLNDEEGYNVLLAYEESIGFCCGTVVFDKDGISALAVFAELLIHVYSGGGDSNKKPCTLMQQLQNLYDKYGEFVSYNGYYLYDDVSVVNDIFNTNIRNHGKYDIVEQLFQEQEDFGVAFLRDLSVPGYDSTTPDHRPKILVSATSSPMITIGFTNGCVAQFRSSGTEPKLKYYLELKGLPGVARHLVEEQLSTMAKVILERILEPSKYGLVEPRK